MQAPQSSSLFSQRSVQIGQIPSSCACPYLTLQYLRSCSSSESVYHGVCDSADGISSLGAKLATRCTVVADHQPDQVVMLYFLHTELSMNLLEYSICNRPSAWPAGRGLLIQSRSRCLQQIRGSAEPFAPWAIKSDTLFVKLCLKLILMYRNPKNPLLSDISSIIV